MNDSKGVYSDPGFMPRTVALVLVSISTVLLIGFQMALWLPTSIEGSAAQVFFYPLLMLGSTGPWAASVAALVLSAIARLRRRTRLATVLVTWSAAVVILAPIALLFVHIYFDLA